MNVLDLVREDLRSFAGYGSARKTGLTGSIWLNANESPWQSPADKSQGLNRYPDPQPAMLRQKLAMLAQTTPERTLVTRGSDEAIDLLVRALCRANEDSIIVSSPTFGMYGVCARVQAAKVIDIPLIDDTNTWRYDVENICVALAAGKAKIVFVCSPANPTGQAIAIDDLEKILSAATGKALVVVDEAYIDYAGMLSAAGMLERYRQLAVLRTLSKAYALAGARIGAVYADPALIKVLAAIAPPYPLPAPSAAIALQGLDDPSLAMVNQRAALVISERNKVASTLRGIAGVSKVYASAANYLLVRFVDADKAMQQLLGAGVVVRDMRAHAVLPDALRITIGSPEENQAMLAALVNDRSEAAA